MDAVYVYLITSSTLFLSGWVVLLLVAYALAFQDEALTNTKVTLYPLGCTGPDGPFPRSAALRQN
jgi:hypothetical protein